MLVIFRPTCHGHNSSQVACFHLRGDACQFCIVRVVGEIYGLGGTAARMRFGRIIFKPVHCIQLWKLEWWKLNVTFPLRQLTVAFSLLNWWFPPKFRDPCLLMLNGQPILQLSKSWLVILMLLFETISGCEFEVILWGNIATVGTEI